MGSPVQPMKICSYCGRENETVMTACQECGTTLPSSAVMPAPALAPATPKPRVVCPACGAHDNYRDGIQLRGSFSWFVFFLGGIIAVLFRNAGQERRVQCNACGKPFGIRTPVSKGSLVVFWLLIAPTIIILILLLIGALFSS